MRIICPNCEAQYEVDPGMIPASGRDVQCSSCGRTWFQAHPSQVEVVPAEEPETGVEARDVSDDGLGEEAAAFFAEEPGQMIERALDNHRADASAEEQPETAVHDARAEPEEVTEPAEGKAEEQPPEPAEPDITPEPKEETASQDDSDAEPPETHEPDASDEEEEEEEETVAGGDIPRREIDPKVLGILRAEAEREIAARRAEEARGLETQTEFGLEEPEDGGEPSEVEMRTARLRGDDGDWAEEDRRAILPDIDDINATLTATSDRDIPEMPAEIAKQVQSRRSGFRLGFTTVMGVMIAVILVYLYAPQIAKTVPSLEPTLAAYVDWANGVRLAIDNALARSVEALSDRGT